MEYKKISNIRREYGEHGLSIAQVDQDPLIQFQSWLHNAVTSCIDDPTAMVLATVDQKGMPDTRVVLLKDIKDNQIIFFTNYLSAKSEQLACNAIAALNLYWPQLARQVRIRGKVFRVDESISDAYFATRPRSSQISAIISPQSKVITGRDELEQRVRTFEESKQNTPILTRPDYWGGYAVVPFEFEFWQGRDNRLHDRIRYRWQDEEWLVELLAP